MTKARKNPTEHQIAEQTGKGFSSAEISRLEFHRHGLALFPAPEDSWLGIAILVEDEGLGSRRRVCSCSVYEKRTCHHIQNLTDLARVLDKKLDGKTLHQDFRSSIWYRLAEILSDGCREKPDSVSFEALDRKWGEVSRVCDSFGKVMIRCYLERPARVRFMERCVAMSDLNAVPTRGVILDRLGLRHISAAGGWIDCESAEFERLTPILDRFRDDPGSSEAGNIGLSRMDLFRVYAGAMLPCSRYAPLI